MCQKVGGHACWLSGWVWDWVVYCFFFFFFFAVLASGSEVSFMGGRRNDAGG